MALYPNPSSGQFEIAFTSNYSDTYSVEVINNIGEIVYSEKIENFQGSFKKKIDIESISSGIYMVKLINSKSSATRKLIVR
jgi:type IV secretory pathway TraG/TraD family ATPase VirD4